MSQHGGVGFAANQMGLPYRVFAMNIGGQDKFYYNPEILQNGDEVIVVEEGCLSFPQLMLKVKRPATVRVRYQDRHGALYEEGLDGLAARCFQHELDHLDGVCFTDRVSKLTLSMARKRRSKTQRNK